MHEMSRRGFFGLAAATAGGAVALPLLSGVAQAAPARPQAADTKQIWKLVPDPHACGACLGHAANKRFADEQAANDHRAHKGCRCTTAPADTIATVAYEQLFKATPVVDLRDDQTAVLIESGGGSPVPVSMAAALPLAVLLGGSATAFYLWSRRQHRKDAAPDAPPGA